MIVTINVNGKIFQTTKSTIIRSEYFRNLFNDTEIQDTIYLDRSSTIFYHVLEYLRDPQYHYPVKYMEELKFYLITYVNPNKVLDENLNKLIKEADFMYNRLGTMEREVLYRVNGGAIAIGPHSGATRGG